MKEFIYVAWTRSGQKATFSVLGRPDRVTPLEVVTAARDAVGPGFWGLTLLEERILN